MSNFNLRPRQSSARKGVRSAEFSVGLPHDGIRHRIQQRKREYLMYKNRDGVVFVVRKLTVWDEFDEKYNEYYVAYALPEVDEKEPAV